jgi:transposase
MIDRFRPLTGRGIQRRLESYGLYFGFSEDLVTITRDILGSRVHRSESPLSSPNTSTTVDGTVVRSESERSIALTSLDSMGFDTRSSASHGTKIQEGCGQHVRQHVGSKLKYSRYVGQHVGLQMTTGSGTITGREIRALEMLRDGHRVADTTTQGKYIVASQSGAGLYQVEGVGIPGLFESCTCPDFKERLVPCKHIFLVRNWIQETPRILPTQSAQSSGRRTQINWPIYNRAQKEEGRLFPVLLRELCAGVAESERDPHKAGRPRIPLRDQIFCAIQKVHSGFSCRRSHGNRVAAAEKGQIGSVPHWGMTSDLLCRSEVNAALLDMLERSTLPLRAIENRCAIDSTGFRTTRFHYYRKEKYADSRENIWLKAHALVGIRTHAVLAMDVTEGTAGDSPRFPILLERAVKAGFNLKEVYADKAYQSRKNFDVAEELGATAFIPFKSNSTGESKGSPAYHKMFLFFTYHRDKFDEHYGNRAQVETSFGSIKQILDETIASRNFDAQVNELFCKAIAHNIRMLIHAMLELGVLPDFLTPSEGAQPDAPAGISRPVQSLLSVNSPPPEPPVVLSPSSR